MILWDLNVWYKEDVVNDEVEVEEGSGRAKIVAWKCQQQTILQPKWVESDRRFQRDETLLPALMCRSRGK